MPDERLLPTSAERCLGMKRPRWQGDFSFAAAPSPERTARNLRASAERAQDCAANEAAGSASDEGAGATRWHCQSSYHLLGLRLP